MRVQRYPALAPAALPPLLLALSGATSVGGRSSGRRKATALNPDGASEQLLAALLAETCAADAPPAVTGKRCGWRLSCRTVDTNSIFVWLDFMALVSPAHCPFMPLPVSTGSTIANSRVPKPAVTSESPFELHLCSKSLCRVLLATFSCRPQLELGQYKRELHTLCLRTLFQILFSAQNT